MPKKAKKLYTGRDTLMVKIKNGVTKAAVHTDRKKEANKNKSNEDVMSDEDAICRQCHFPLRDGVYTSMPDGFCGDSCKDFYNEQHGED